MTEAQATPDQRRKAFLALLVVVPVPAFGAWMGLIENPGPVGQTIFAASKIWILVVPWLWVRFVEGIRPRPTLAFPGRKYAIGTGLAFAVVIVGAYLGFARDAFDLSAIGPTVADAGIDSKAKYLWVAIYWTLVNSLIEEYVWRWFVATKCEVLVPRAAAIVLAAAFFSIHHYVALVAYVDSGAAALGTAGVFLASMIWSWLYLRFRSVVTPYVSHVIADAAIFAVGYDAIFG